MTRPKPWQLLVGALVVLACTLGILAACNTAPPPDPCQINPTKTNASGQWVEQDDEPLDADPCDSDDLYETDSHGNKKPKTPAVKPATVKPAPAKTGGGSGGTTGNKARK
jgi:hypothetical protein